jgi:hypothetical protein
MLEQHLFLRLIVLRPFRFGAIGLNNAAVTIDRLAVLWRSRMFARPRDPRAVSEYDNRSKSTNDSGNNRKLTQFGVLAYSAGSKLGKVPIGTNYE